MPITVSNSWFRWVPQIQSNGGATLGRAERTARNVAFQYCVSFGYRDEMVPAVAGHRRSAWQGALRLSLGVAVGAVSLLPPGGSSVPPAGLTAAAVAAAESAAGASTELAVAVQDRETGEIATGRLGERPFYMASVAKLLVAIDVLDRRRLDGLPVSDADIDLIHRALGPSDDDAMNALWTRFDGAGAAGRTGVRLALTGTGDPSDRSQWGEMLAAAVDIARLWTHVLDAMPPADRHLLLTPMDTAPTHAADGFDQQYGLRSTAVDGPGAPGAVTKQGWLCCFSGRYYLHSTGAVGTDQRYVVVLLATLPRGPGWAAARQELSTIAAAAVKVLVPPAQS